MERPHLPTLFTTEKLALRGWRIGADGLAELLSDRIRVSAVESLDLEGNRVGDAGVEVLANAPLRCLHSLNLADNDLTAAGVERLAHSRLVKTLASLHLGHNQLDALGMAALARWEGRLSDALSLTGNPLDDAGAHALAGLQARPRTLGVERCRLRASGIAPLVPLLRGATSLWLGANPLYDVGAEALAEAGVRPIQLDLARTMLGTAGLVALLHTPTLSNTRYLDLRMNALDDDALARLASAELPNLVVLKLSFGSRAAIGALRDRFEVVTSADRPAVPAMATLCPYCRRVVGAHDFRCGHCRGLIYQDAVDEVPEDTVDERVSEVCIHCRAPVHATASRCGACLSWVPSLAQRKEHRLAWQKG